MKQGMIGRIIAFMIERANAAVDPAKQEGRSQTERAIRKIVYVLGAGAAAIVVFAMSRCSWGQFLASASVGLLAAGASCLAGAILGFLFGVPKSAGQKETPAQGAEAAETGAGAKPPSPAGSPAFESNTNLEQISDWLTKILVGIGLTQFDAIAERTGRLAKIVTDGLMAGGGCHGDSGAAYPVAGLAILLGFAICGFLLTYLWTRRYLMREFVKAEEEASLRARAEAAEDNLATLARAASKGTVQGLKGSAPRFAAQISRFAAPSLDLAFEKAGEIGPLVKEEGGIVPGSDSDDPWKGAFGGKASLGGAAWRRRCLPCRRCRAAIWSSSGCGRKTTRPSPWRGR